MKHFMENPYHRPAHVSAHPAGMDRRAEDPFRLQIYSHAAADHVQGTLKKTAFFKAG